MKAKDGYDLVTGGAGFIGSNVANRLLDAGEQVVLLDDLSRPSVAINARWLEERYGKKRCRLQVADVRDVDAVRKEVQGAKRVFHFAAQVAVTTSLQDPRADFEINARGTLNVLEAMREMASPPSMVFTSTNKVYGALDDVALEVDGERYTPTDPDIAARGIGERRPCDFHSPYGCSKGAADQYVLDYARTFGLPAAVFRMSCIYGPRQFGTEEQGWVAHFAKRALEGAPLTLYGDGRQVRDVLFVDDLVDAFLTVTGDMERCAGKAFNIGGGAANAVSLREVLAVLEGHLGRPVERSFGDWRPGDQRYYVTDHHRFSELTGWRPKVSVQAGVERLLAWLEPMMRPAGERGGARAVARAGEATP